MRQFSYPVAGFRHHPGPNSGCLLSRYQETQRRDLKQPGDRSPRSLTVRHVPETRGRPITHLATPPPRCALSTKRSRSHFSRIRDLATSGPPVRLTIRPPLALRRMRTAVFCIQRRRLPPASQPSAPMQTRGPRLFAHASPNPGTDQGHGIVGVQHREDVLRGQKRRPPCVLELHEQRMDFLGSMPVRLPGRPEPPILGSIIPGHPVSRSMTVPEV